MSAKGSGAGRGGVAPGTTDGGLSVAPAWDPARPALCKEWLVAWLQDVEAVAAASLALRGRASYQGVYGRDASGALLAWDRKLTRKVRHVASGTLQSMDQLVRQPELPDKLTAQLVRWDEWVSQAVVAVSSLEPVPLTGVRSVDKPNRLLNTRLTRVQEGLARTAIWTVDHPPNGSDA